MIQTEVLHGWIGTTWLPALALGAGAVALVAVRRGQRAPLSGSWAADLALIAAALLLTLRAYNDFGIATYGAYYVAPLLLLSAIAHERIGERRPELRPVLLGALAAVAVSLVAASITGRSADEPYKVSTARGAFFTTPEAGPPLQDTIDFLRAHSRPSDELVALPADAGVYFGTGLRPGLYELTVFPGTLPTGADEDAAIARLRSRRVPWVVLGNGRFTAWDAPRIGVDFNRRLIDAIRSDYRVRTEFGDFATVPKDTSTAYRVYELR